MQTRYTRLLTVALYKEISFLDRAASEMLITRPVRDFYSLTRKAVHRIIEVTSGHPYFIRLLCHNLFSYWQRNVKSQLGIDDVNSVMEEVVERGSATLRIEWDGLGPVEKLILAPWPRGWAAPGIGYYR
jgi:hypothetical protein